MCIVLIPSKLKEHLLLEHFLETLWQFLKLSSGHWKVELGEFCPMLGGTDNVDCSGVFIQPLLGSSMKCYCPVPPLAHSVLLRTGNRVSSCWWAQVLPGSHLAGGPSAAFLSPFPLSQELAQGTVCTTVCCSPAALHGHASNISPQVDRCWSLPSLRP